METIKSSYRLDAREHGVVLPEGNGANEPIIKSQVFDDEGNFKKEKLPPARLNPDQFDQDELTGLIGHNLAFLDARINALIAAAAGTGLATPILGFGTITVDTISMSWPSVSNATSYVLDRSLDGITYTNAYTGPLLAFNDTGRAESTAYFYRLKAKASGFTDSPYAAASRTTASSGGGGAVNDLLNGKTFISNAIIRNESTSDHEIVNGTPKYTNDSGEMRIMLNLRVKNGSQVAFRAKGDCNGIVGLRHDDDIYGVEQGLGLSTYGNILFGVNYAGNGTVDAASAPIANNWYVGTFNGGSGLWSWQTTPDGVNYTNVDLGSGTGDIRPKSIGDFLVVQIYADGVANRVLSSVQYSGFDVAT